MLLLLPRDYGVAVGQRYEVCPHLPGERPPPHCGLIGSAWVTVVRVQGALQTRASYVVEVVRDPIDTGSPSRTE